MSDSVSVELRQLKDLLAQLEHDLPDNVLKKMITQLDLDSKIPVSDQIIQKLGEDKLEQELNEGDFTMLEFLDRVQFGNFDA